MEGSLGAVEALEYCETWCVILSVVVQSICVGECVCARARLRVRLRLCDVAHSGSLDSHPR
eukprot:888481-Rhodomonas_salina.1